MNALIAFAPVSVNPAVLIGLVAVACVGIGVALFKVDTKREELRKLAIEVSGEAKALGFEILPAFLVDVGVGDVSGAIREFKRLLAVLRDPEKRKSEFKRIFEIMLEQQFKNPDERPTLLKKIADMTAATTSAAPVAATPALPK